MIVRLIAAKDSAVDARDWVERNVPDSIANALYAAFVRARHEPVLKRFKATG